MTQAISETAKDGMRFMATMMGDMRPSDRRLYTLCFDSRTVTQGRLLIKSDQPDRSLTLQRLFTPTTISDHFLLHDILIDEEPVLSKSEPLRTGLLISRSQNRTEHLFAGGFCSKIPIRMSALRDEHVSEMCLQVQKGQIVALDVEYDPLGAAALSARAS